MGHEIFLKAPAGSAFISNFAFLPIDSNLYGSYVSGQMSATVIVKETGKSATIPVDHGTVRATDLKKVGLTSYDPGYFNTALCKSAITYIDGEKGILRYRGYPIEELAEQSSFLEVSYLLYYGELPTKGQLTAFAARTMHEPQALASDVIRLINGFRSESHSMSVMVSALAALGAVYPDANPALAGNNLYSSAEVRERQYFRLLGAFPAIAAHFLLRRNGSQAANIMPLDTSDPYCYTESYLRMMGLGYAHADDTRPHPKVVRALDTLLVVHADHELNCSTAALRHLTTSGVDVFTAVSGATGALYGPLHGGATEAVLRMLEKIGTVDKIPGFLAAVKAKKERLMGFGHRVYRNYDPRAKIVRRLAYEVFEIYGADPLINLATTLEQTAREDDYFVSRQLYPNIDYYSGLIYKAIGFPTDYFPVLFTMGRMAGWLAHWNELLQDPEIKLVRPRQVYVGHDTRPYTPIGQRHQQTEISRSRL